jgi:2-oxoglutarate ferredoxin oxidoreductase subunit delta
MVKINEAFCKGCGYCVKFCPKQILVIGQTRNRRGHFYPELTNAASCITCAVCATMCPEGAIEVLKGGSKS